MLTLVLAGIVFLAWVVGNIYAHAIVHDFPLYLKGQLWVIGQLALYSMVPAIVGMIYQKAFAKWFTLSFVTLAFLQLWLIKDFRIEFVSGESRATAHADWTEELFLALESFLLVLFVLFRVRRYHSSRFHKRASIRRRPYYCMAATLLAVIAHILCFWVFGSGPVQWYSLGFIVSLEVILVGVVASAALLTGREFFLDNRGKNIVICVDGTWNQPGQQDYGYLAETNVYKLFKMLEGCRPYAKFDASQTKVYNEEYRLWDRDPGESNPDNRAPTQIAFYYNGVGNRVENSQLGQLFGGAFGMGASSIVQRAYLDLVRVYEPGDRIYIYGFSRGAAIARLIAGVISRRGIPQSVLTLRFFGRHWTLKASRKKWADVPIAVLGCWDTVGAFGLAKNLFGIPFQEINLFKDLTVADNVKRAYHMVALDETRDAFAPTLMNPDPTRPERIVEVWFPGNHSNVGGGYATDRLSNITLDFLLRRVSSGYATDKNTVPGDPSWGMYLTGAHHKAFAQKTIMDINDPKAEINSIDTWEGGRMFRPIEKVVPNPLGQIRHADGPIYNHMPRELPDYAVIHDSVVKRMKDGMPMYAPESLFQLNQRILEKRDAIRTKVDKLKGTGSITETEAEEVKEWSESKLKIVKWEDYLEKKVMSERGRRTIGELINPAKELGPDGNFEPTSPASGSNGHPWRVFRRRWNPPADKSEEKNDSPPEKTDSPNDSSD